MLNVTKFLKIEYDEYLSIHFIYFHPFGTVEWAALHSKSVTSFVNFLLEMEAPFERLANRSSIPWGQKMCRKTLGNCEI